MSEITEVTSNTTKVLDDMLFTAYQELIAESVSLATINTNKTPLGFDAWGRNKAVLDASLFHGVFTYDVPNRMWIEGFNGVEQPTKVNATSENGMLKLVSNGGNSGLRSKRHARYQPNRGHLYSSSMILPSPTANGIRDFGLGDEKNGAFFRVKATGLYGVIRTTFDGVTTDDEQLISHSVDLSKGNVYDIQMQWRGVGDIKFFINLKEVYIFSYLGTLTAMSISNPALPIGFYCQNVTEDVTMYCGCVDVTSEGGVMETRQYNSVTTGMDVTAINADSGSNGSAILAITLPFQVGGFPYTRDAILNRVTTFSKDEATTGVWAFRYSSGAASLALYNHILAAGTANDSYVGFSIGGDISTLNTLFAAAVAEGQLLVTRREEIDRPCVLDNPDKSNSEFLITGGDIIVVSVRPDGDNKNTGCSIEFSEEI